MANQGNPSFNAAKTAKTHGMLVFIMVVLVAGAAALNYLASDRQASLMQVSNIAQQEYTLAQHLAALVTQYQGSSDQKALAELKDATPAALNGHGALQPKILALMGLPPSTGEASGDARALNTLHEMVDKTFTFMAYTNASQGQDAQEYADSVIALSQKDLPEQWDAMTKAMSATVHQKIDIMTYASYGLCALLVCLMMYEASMLFAPAIRTVTEQKEQLDHLVATDMLTGFYNRSMLFKVAATIISGSKRHKHELTALALDLDRFKDINDAYGRAVGDAAIRAVAGVIQNVLRNSDLMGRLGGAEFAIFLPSTDEYRAELVAEKLRLAIEELPFSVKERVILLHASVGVAQMQDTHKNPDDMLRAAEAAMRYAKEAGRNRVVAFSKMGAPPENAKAST